MEIKRILWPTDFSENAGQALPLVERLRIENCGNQFEFAAA